jgi:tetratricopeptide (TPR) repeat protein
MALREISEQEANRFNRAYERGCALAEREIMTHDSRRRGRPGWFGRRRLRKAVDALRLALSVVPESWPAHWLQGKVHLRLDESRQALECFRRAFEINPGHPDVAREASIAAMEMGDGLEAVRFAEAAVSSNPEDVGLVANLALALLIRGDTDAAAARAADAVARAPEDAISQFVKRVADDVAAGRRPRPENGRDLQ